MSIADHYYDAIRSSSLAAIPGEPEAQLTNPIDRLFTDIASLKGLGQIHLVRETKLGRTRPDFSMSSKHSSGLIHHGFIELKAPGTGADPSLWKGRNANQWMKMKTEAENIIITDGHEARLFLNGIQVGEPAPLPYASTNQWDETPLVNMLRRFLQAKPRAVTTVSDLSTRLAMRARDIRDRLTALISTDGPARVEANAAHRAWKKYVHPHATEANFCDDVAQVVSYGMTLAALTGENLPARLTVRTARDALRNLSPVMAAAFSPLIEKQKLLEAARSEIGALEALINAIDRDKVNASADQRGDPWLYFYEDFLSAYDPKARKEAGVYYTPLPVVKAMVNVVDHVLTTVFGRKQGFADPNVITLDPAAGTGTFPLAVVDKAIERSASGANAMIGGGRAASVLGRNLYAFELLPGPYSVAHLRLTQRLSALSGGKVESAQVLLADTLDSPDEPHEPDLEFGDGETLTLEQMRVQEVKRQKPITAIIGNPPYRRVKGDDDGRGSGGWVMKGKVSAERPQPLFDDILNIAKAGTKFSHHASLYNLYVYFWRWAIWKAFEDHGDDAGVVSFITASSWLDGPGFIGLRQITREICDDIWVIDLGGGGNGANPEKNVFAIKTPIAIVTLVRKGPSDRSRPAVVHYRRIQGTGHQKLEAMTELSLSVSPLTGDWNIAQTEWTSSFIPEKNDEQWTSMPKIVDLFPWQQPGCMVGRSWPIAPLAQMLSERWDRFVSTKPGQEREDAFVTTSGRKIATEVSGLPRLSTLKPGDAHQAIVRYGYRSYDRQFIFNDPRLAKTESPSLWANSSPRQIFLVSTLTDGISAGQAMSVSAYVPDKHMFNGRGGKDIIPIWRDAACTQPNMTPGLASVIQSRLGIENVCVEDLAAYIHAIVGTPSYQERFANHLASGGIRIPITEDAVLWNEAVSLGRRLIAAQTFGERMGQYHSPIDLPDLLWTAPVTRVPLTKDEIHYQDGILSIGDGRLAGVPAEIWSYQISGRNVLRSWLGYRTIKGAGRAASSPQPLDAVRPIEWTGEWDNELIEIIIAVATTLALSDKSASLLEKILSGPCIHKNDVPVPNEHDRSVPKNITGQLFQ